MRKAVCLTLALAFATTFYIGLFAANDLFFPAHTAPVEEQE